MTLKEIELVKAALKKASYPVLPTLPIIEEEPSTYRGIPLGTLPPLPFEDDDSLWSGNSSSEGLGREIVGIELDGIDFGMDRSSGAKSELPTPSLVSSMSPELSRALEKQFRARLGINNYFILPERSIGMPSYHYFPKLVDLFAYVEGLRIDFFSFGGRAVRDGSSEINCICLPKTVHIPNGFDSPYTYILTEAKCSTSFIWPLTEILSFCRELTKHTEGTAYFSVALYDDGVDNTAKYAQLSLPRARALNFIEACERLGVFQNVEGVL